jgi:hypothetical protein
LVASEPHNGLTIARTSAIFGPLIFCANDPANIHQPLPKKADLLDAQQASNILRMLIENWPARNSEFLVHFSQTGQEFSEETGGKF